MSWVHYVLNPWVDCLAQEVRLLSEGNLTFRWYSQDFEFVRPLREYVPPLQLPVMEDLIQARPDLGSRVSEHDSKRDELKQAAVVAYGKLKTDPAFFGTLNQTVEGFQPKRQEVHHDQSGTADSNLLDRVAEWVVNNIRTLPTHYEDSKFWEQSSLTLLEFRRADYFGPVREHSGSALKVFAALQVHLRKVRFELIDDYDIPPSPAPAFTPSGT